MAKKTLQFRYLTGLKQEMFHNARLAGSWDSSGRYSQVWSETPMTPGQAEDGCPCFTAQIELDESEIGKRFRWGVRLDGPSGPNVWGIPTEINDMNSAERYREFELKPYGGTQTQDFYLTYGRRLGARKFFSGGTCSAGLAIFCVGTECQVCGSRVPQIEQRLHRR
jgi:1,4-alpha-glucan branching enzyme